MKSISSAFLCILMFIACGNQVKNSGLFHQGKESIIIAVNTSHSIGYFVDSEGTFLFNKQFERVWSFSEGLAPIRQNDKWGFINTQGEVVIPCIYDDTRWFSEGLARVEQNDKWGYINTKGWVVVPCIYDWAENFKEGLARVKQNGKYSIINKEGKVIVAECDEWNTSWSKVEME